MTPQNELLKLAERRDGRIVTIATIAVVVSIIAVGGWPAGFWFSLGGLAASVFYLWEAGRANQSSTQSENVE